MKPILPSPKRIRGARAKTPKLNGATVDMARILRPQAITNWMLPSLAGITPKYIEMILANAMAGSHSYQHELFQKMLDTWPELAACVAELTEGVLNLEPDLDAAESEDDTTTPEATARLALVKAALFRMQPDPATDEIEFNGMVRELVDGWICGCSVQEIIWHARQDKTNGTFIAPKALAAASPRDFGFEHGLMGLRTDKGLVPFPPDKFIVGVHKTKSGTVPAGALLRPLAWWWCAANFSASYLLRLAELFGIPFRWGTYAATSAPETVDKICKMLQNMGASGWAAFPEGVTMELKETSGKGSDHSPQGELLDRADRYARLLILGQTMSGSQDASKGGGKAFGSVEADVKATRIDACADYAATVINGQLIPAILRMNYGNTDDAPCLEFESEEEEDLAQTATIVKTLADAGAGKVIGLGWLGKKFGIPAPEAGEETLADGKPDVTQQPGQQPGQIDEGLTNEPTSARDAALARVLAIEDDALFSKALSDLANISE